MNTTQKHLNFVSEPIGEKPVTALAGIGQVLGKRLLDKRFDKAYLVLGQSLLLRQNRGHFTEWLNNEIGANRKQANDCYNCLKEWCDAFL